ncbi:diguanylate cyclase domain-containing protein, partial [Acidihalobacter prosperus]
MKTHSNTIHRSPNRALFSWIEILIGVGSTLLLSLLLALMIAWVNFNQSKQTYKKQAKTIIELISQRWRSEHAALTFLSGLQNITVPTDTNDLASISTTLLHNYPYIFYVAYLNWVPGNKRREFVQSMRANGYPQFHIHPVGKSNKSVPAHSSALVLSFIYPHTPHNEVLLGTDLTSNQRIDSVVKKALKNHGQQVMVRMPHLTTKPSDYLTLVAIHKKTVPSNHHPELAQHSNGMFMISLNMPAMFRDIHASHPLWNISIVGLDKPSKQNPLAFRAENKSHEKLFYWLPAFGVTRTLTFGQYRTRIHLNHRLALSDIRPGTVLLVALLPWILLLVLASFIGLRRYAKRTQFKTQHELEQGREQAEIALNSITDAVITTDDEMHVQFMNPVASRLTGWPMAMALGCKIGEIAPLLEEHTREPLPTDPKKIGSYINKAMEGLLLSRDGSRYVVEFRFSALTRYDVTIGGIALVLRDLTRERELKSALDYQSTRDPLTGLLNRRSFETYLRQWLNNYRSGNPTGALCQVDLNHFKLVNDTAGHHAGDELLRQFAWLLDTALPAGTALARLGADEFGILISSETEHEPPPQQLAEHLIEAARAFNFTWEQQSFNIGANIGLVMITNAQQDAGDLLVKADLACLTSKDKGRNSLHIYETSDEAIARRSGQMLWLARLQDALHADQFILYTQPIQPLSSSASPQEMHEFLLRMQLDDGTQAQPDLFIPAAERYQLMAELDRRVVDLAFALIARSAGSTQDTLYTINLSGQSVGDPNLASYILERIRYHDVSPGQVCFEITETAAITNMHAAQTLINQLRAHGMQFA